MSRSAVTKNVSLFFNCRHRQTLLLLAPAQQQQQQQQRSCNDFHGSNVQVGNDDVENHDVDVENMNKMHFSKLVRLDRAWRRGDPEFVRQECASFVLSLEIVETVFDRCRCDENGNGDSGTRAPAITLVAGLNNGDIEEWDLGNHTLVRVRESAHLKGVKCMARTKDYLISASYDTTVKVWRNSDWRLCLTTLVHHSEAVWEVRIFQDRFVTCGMDGNVFVLVLDEAQNFPIQFSITTQSDLASSVDMSQDYILTGCDNATVGVWDAETGANIHMMEGHLQGVTAVRIENESKIAASGSYDCRVRVWNAEHGICIAVLKGHRDLVRCLELSPKRIASGDFAGFLKVWDLHHIVTEANRNMEKVLRKKETERGKGGQSGEEEESLCYEPVDIFEHRSLLTHKSHVTCLYIDCTGLISGSRDKMLVWQNFWKEI